MPFTATFAKFNSDWPLGASHDFPSSVVSFLTVSEGGNCFPRFVLTARSHFSYKTEIQADGRKQIQKRRINTPAQVSLRENNKIFIDLGTKRYLNEG